MRECTGSIRKFGKDKSSEKYICSSSSVGIAHDSAVYRFIKSLYLLYFSCLATALSYSRAATISRIYITRPFYERLFEGGYSRCAGDIIYTVFPVVFPVRGATLL